MTEALTEESVEFVPAAENPAAVEAAAAAVTDGEAGPELPLPQDGPVTLPGGFRRMVPGTSPPQFETVRKAWVKELDGFAEEHIAKAQLKQDFGEYLNAILEAGVEKIGDSEPTPVDLRDLLAGDREYLLVQISIATYGDEIEYKGIICPGCGDSVDVTITKSDEIPVVGLNQGEDTNFTFKTRKGRSLTVHYPTVNDQAYAYEGGTGAESNSLLLSRIVEEFHGDPDEARGLSMGDRNKLLDVLGTKNPGPRYNGVKFPHDPGCGAEVGLVVTLADLFPGMLLP